MSRLVVPAAARDLPRRSQKWFGWKRSLPDHRDVPHLYMPHSVEGQPRKASLDPTLLPPTRNQGEQGSCTGHAMRGIGQYMRAYEKQAKHELSPRFIYFNGRVIEGTQDQDSGCEIRDVMKAVAEKGFAAEKDCPYNWRNFTRVPSSAAYKHALQDMAIDYQNVVQDLRLMKQAILDKQGFALGFTVYANFADDGMCPMPQGEVEGGHAVWAVAYDDDIAIAGQTGGFCIQNSWDTDWGLKGPNGQGGYFWLPYKYIADANLAADFWTIKRIT